MHVVFHIGAHFTDEDRLVRSLLKNRETLLDQGIVVPGPGQYRKALRDVVNKLRGARPSPEAREVILDAISTGDGETLFLSNDSFICLPERVLDDGRLYARAHKSAWLRNTFPDAEVSFAIGLRDPGTLIPALYQNRRDRDLAFPDFIAGVDPAALRWSDTIARVRDENPDCEVVTWCNEDTPLIWSEVMRQVTGLDALTPLEGDLDIVLQILSDEGRRVLELYLAEHPPETEVIRRRVLSAFLERYAVDETIEEVIDLPGWDAGLMDALSEAYDEDTDLIAQMPGVTFVAP